MLKLCHHPSPCRAQRQTFKAYSSSVSACTDARSSCIRSTAATSRIASVTSSDLATLTAASRVGRWTAHLRACRLCLELPHSPGRHLQQRVFPFHSLNPRHEKSDHGFQSLNSISESMIKAGIFAPR
eukprot:1910949-Rhodomonas_salina.1